MIQNTFATWNNLPILTNFDTSASLFKKLSKHTSDSMVMLQEILCIFTLSLLHFSSGSNDLARGWGDGIDWVSLSDGMKLSKEKDMPLMLVIHKSWCGACKALKPQFGASAEIQELSKNFIMVNTQDDEEPPEQQYSPDGGYIPRILFLDSDGKVEEVYKNEGGNPSYKYYYPEPTQIAKSMGRVAEIKIKIKKDKSSNKPDEL